MSTASVSTRAADYATSKVFALVVAAGAWLAPVRPLMLAVGVLIAMDALTGLAASLREKRPITSRRAFDSAIKMAVYQCCVVTGMVLEQHMFGGQVPAAKMVGTVLLAIEAKSILENGERIAGRPIFRALRERLKRDDDK